MDTTAIDPFHSYEYYSEDESLHQVCFALQILKKCNISSTDEDDISGSDRDDSVDMNANKK